MKLKKLSAIILSLVLAASAFAGCAADKDTAADSAGGGDTASKDPSKPDTYIADRAIVVRTFNEDLAQGPTDPLNNVVTKKVKELTGCTLEVQYTSGPGSLEALTTAFAAGNMPDAIIYYLNNSARPEFPVVLKGAKEGVLLDVAPLLKETKIYSKYYDEAYMPTDSYKNILQRKDLNGGTYHVPMRIEREVGSNDEKLRGGMWIQETIVKALDIKPWEIKTSEDLYNLAKKIKDGNFKDSFGKPITPIGPSYWGGSNSMPENVIQNLDFGGQSDSFAYLDGVLKHKVETAYVMDQINFVRKLIADGLMHKEALTMEENRAKEGAHSYSWGIIGSTHNRTDVFKDYQYVPFRLNDIDNEYVEMTSGKAQYGSWSIPKTTKNPEQVVKFADFIASKEGKLLYNYGIEGEHYTIKDGKVMITDEMLAKSKEGDNKFFQNIGIYAGGLGSRWYEIFGETDMDKVADFGEMFYGNNADPELDKIPTELYNYGMTERPYERTIVMNGFSPMSYLDTFENGAELRTLLDSKGLNDIRVKAVFAKTEKESKAIMDDYLKQMNNAGLQEFKAHLEKVRKEDIKMLFIEEYKAKG